MRSWLLVALIIVAGGGGLVRMPLPGQVVQLTLQGKNDIFPGHRLRMAFGFRQPFYRIRA